MVIDRSEIIILYVHALNSLDVAMLFSKQTGWRAADDRKLITTKRLET